MLANFAGQSGPVSAQVWFPCQPLSLERLAMRMCGFCGSFVFSSKEAGGWFSTNGASSNLAIARASRLTAPHHTLSPPHHNPRSQPQQEQQAPAARAIAAAAAAVLAVVGLRRL